MKTQIKNQVSALVLATLLTCPISSQARVVQDINQAAGDLLGHAPLVTNVFDAQNKKLDSSNPAAQPWSSSYWPDILGGIANHFQKRHFLGDLVSFLLRYDVAKSRALNDHQDVVENFNSWDNEDLNYNLSPAEKYDLLLGDKNFTFSKAVLDDIDFRARYRKTSVTSTGTELDPVDQFDGDDNTGMFADVQKTYAAFDDKVSYKYWKRKGDSIAYWFGICDGWAPSAVTLPRPERSVTVTGALGHRITFTPDDLKALGSYLYARTNNDYMTTMNYHFAGRPCAGGKVPETQGIDDKNPGWVKDFRCNDVDAGVWHMTLLNRVGLDKKGFVFEIDNNRKINNHPVSGYSLKYFNPATGEEGSLRNSIAVRKTVNDAYASRRHPRAVYLVGVKSKFTYMNYQWPESHKSDKWEKDSPSQDKTKELEYTYDLELDATGNILGGEWGDRSADKVRTYHGNKVIEAVYAAQPDFIWMAAPQNLPHSEMSQFTHLWSDASGLPYTSGDRADASVFATPYTDTKWQWGNGTKALPDEWLRAAVSDEMWQAPVTVDGSTAAKDEKGNIIVPEEARGSTMKSAQPLSNIVFYLFDRARMPRQF